MYFCRVDQGWSIEIGVKTLRQPRCKRISRRSTPNERASNIVSQTQLAKVLVQTVVGLRQKLSQGQKNHVNLAGNVKERKVFYVVSHHSLYMKSFSTVAAQLNLPSPKSFQGSLYQAFDIKLF